ncbi:hypothetical protein [Paraclostridium dentum]|uniref:hypothetical protein n=1 Tax=Paraclostridium dentum TaxID=2662455 RepID=UPI003464DD5F
MNKKIIGMGIAVAVAGVTTVTPMINNVYANDIDTKTVNTYSDVSNHTYKNSKGENILVEINKDIENKVSDEEIKILIEEAREGDKVVVSDIFFNNNDINENEGNDVRPRISYYSYTKTSKSNVKYNQLIGSKFICSVAKGQKRSIKRDFSMSSSVGGSYKKLIEITGNGKASYSVNNTFSGPPENSRYNSREFRVKFVGESGRYTQRVYEVVGPKHNLKSTYTGTYKIPKKGLMYNIDRKI